MTMKKSYATLLFVIFLVLLLWFADNAVTYVTRYDWSPATATVTFVGLPDGAVIGTYSDSNNNIHTDVPLYTDFFCRGYNAKVDGLIGKEVHIIYNPLTGEVAKSNAMVFWLSLVLLLLSAGITISRILCKRRK